MLGNMPRTKAASLTVVAMTMGGLALAASGWLIFSPRQSVAEDISRLTEPTAPPQPVRPPRPQPTEETDTRPEIDSSLLAARLGSIRNHPVPVPPTPQPSEEPQPEPTPPEPPAEAVRYVGPMRVGSRLMAILSVENRQRLSGAGRSFVYSVEGTSYTARVVEVTPEHVVLEENGVKRTIAVSDRRGDVVSYLGNKPTRGKAPTLRDKAATSDETQPNAGTGNPGTAALLETLRHQITQMIESGDTSPAQLDKLKAEAKAGGLNPDLVDRMAKSELERASQEKK